ncbi:hypothetical protein [Pelagicoccus mobilis]|uniref:Uncharacterized protein n=1 Tax=Pelagicoccus mobilis TaxID=415221 RepID=A0A934RZV8_9BACT|nr:hypothetical protein [Pelagicoccus mobilis]MBK1878399.1 hypothetical protein [Pelagicoccus mobilis]
MKPGAHKDFSKLQIICALFADNIGDDLYFARQIKESIEATLPSEHRDSPSAFLAAAKTLLEQTTRHPDKAIIDLVTAPDAQGYSELALRARLLEALKRTCRFERPLLVLTGLKEAICPTGKRWTGKRKAEYQSAIAYAREFCQSRTRPSSHLNLIIY